jgi:hypothetical protein
VFLVHGFWVYVKLPRVEANLLPTDAAFNTVKRDGIELFIEPILRNKKHSCKLIVILTLISWINFQYVSGRHR